MSDEPIATSDEVKVQAEPEAVDYKAKYESQQALNKELMDQRKQRQEKSKAMEAELVSLRADKTEDGVPDPEVLTLKARLQALEVTDNKRTERLESKYEQLLAKIPPEVLELQKPILDQAKAMSVDNRIDWLEKAIPAIVGGKRGNQEVPIHKPVAEEKSLPTLSDAEWSLARKHGHTKEMAISFKLDDPNFYKKS